LGPEGGNEPSHADAAFQHAETRTNGGLSELVPRGQGLRTSSSTADVIKYMCGRFRVARLHPAAASPRTCRSLRRHRTAATASTSPTLSAPATS
jgi:hypothetical protein